MRISVCLIWFATMTAAHPAEQIRIDPVPVGTFDQEMRTFYTTEDGLPSNDVFALDVGPAGSVFAGTAAGLAQFSEGEWRIVEGVPPSETRLLCTDSEGTPYVIQDGIVFRGDGERIAALPRNLRPSNRLNVLRVGKLIMIGTELGLFQIAAAGQVSPLITLNVLLGDKPAIHDIAIGPNGEIAVAAEAGIYYNDAGNWRKLRLRDGLCYSSAKDVRAITFDGRGRLWLASLEGVGLLAERFHLFTGKEGLPYNDFTCMAAGPKGEIWFGTRLGAIRYNGREWAYRQGLRWLPYDHVRAVAVTPDGSAWFATEHGVGVIEKRPMTLAEKARFFEDEIDRRHRRTEFGFVLEVRVSEPGDKSQWTQHDSDNDGLWTSMYGTGECFAYAATKDPKAKERAQKAFDALRFLGEVTQGGSNPAPRGFVARTILPTSGPNPNEHDYTPERDRERQKRDAYWKVIVPRWPTSADGKWYWKTDTSSDELDGHYFFYAQYYDLVAETEAEKARVREHVRALTDHLIEHDFCLVDHDGKPTRWAVFSPKALNQDPSWFMERGLNSLSVLSYLVVAEHMTGDPKYRRAADELITKHHYAQNTLSPKFHHGIGSGNQSDDEMAFMSYYNLLKYEKDPKLRQIYALSFYNYWRMEEPEVNPFFNFAFASQCLGDTFTDPFGTYKTYPESHDWLVASVQELKRFPLDRFNWGHTNSHRLDVAPLPQQAYTFDEERWMGKGWRIDGRVLPVDERFFNHYNHDPWRLDVGGNGTELADGAVFLLPYYMGLYHGFIVEQ